MRYRMEADAETAMGAAHDGARIALMRAAVAGSLPLLLLAACSAIAPAPGPQSAAGLSADGTVTLHETFASGAGLGGGTLEFRGRSYPFQLAGTVLGGGGLDSIRARGEVFNLTAMNDFAGVYRQSAGAPGITTSGASDLWLKNGAGVVMHLTGTQSGDMLSLGGEEILIRMQP